MLTQFETEILPLFEAHRQPWLDRAREVAAELGKDGAWVTVDQVRAKCPPPADKDPRCMGGIFLRSEWVNDGHVKGFRSASHGRSVVRWQLKEFA